MNRELSLIEVQTGPIKIDLLAEAEVERSLALEQAALVGVVHTPAHQEKAVAAQARLHRLVTAIERARKAAKEPFLEAGRDIDTMAKRFRLEIDSELMRIGKAVGDYQALELAKQRAAEAARLEELAEAERQREAEIAKAKSLQEQQEIRERYAQSAEFSKPPEEPPRAKGQTVREEWEITVSDIYTLARCHPNCVKITPLLSEIKALLDMGQTVRGVKAEKVIKSGVRAAAQPVIDV